MMHGCRRADEGNEIVRSIRQLGELRPLIQVDGVRGLSRITQDPTTGLAYIAPPAWGFTLAQAFLEWKFIAGQTGMPVALSRCGNGFFVVTPRTTRQELDAMMASAPTDTNFAIALRRGHEAMQQQASHSGDAFAYTSPHDAKGGRIA